MANEIRRIGIFRIKNNDIIEIESYSVQDGKTYSAQVTADSYGRLSFQNLN